MRIFRQATSTCCRDRTRIFCSFTSSASIGCKIVQHLTMFRLTTCTLVFFAAIFFVRAADVHSENTSLGASDGSDFPAASENFDLPVVVRSARRWQVAALARAQKQLQRLKRELRTIVLSEKCRINKGRLLRTLYRKKKLLECHMSNLRKASKECKKKYRLQRSVNAVRRKCKWNRKCLSRHVWRLQWKLRKARMACNCLKKMRVVRQIWRVKRIRCLKTRNKAAVVFHIKKVKNRIKYLKKILRPRPSMAPRPKRN